MERTVLKQKDRFHYDLPHEAYDAHIYPRQSSNGSTVIIYGHDEGLRIAWYAGRSFKPAKKDATPPKINGAAKADAMVIDLDDDDDDEPATKEHPPAPAEHEQEEEEIDPAAPYADFLRCIDIPLGTAAVRIAVPNIVKDLEQAPPESWPSLYLNRIVVTVACADLSIRLISVPLDPPTPGVDDASRLGIDAIKIFGPNSHQDFISDIAITHTAGVEDDQEGSQQQQGGYGSSKAEQSSDSRQWSLLIASVSCTGAGLLLVHQVPVQSHSISSAPEHHLPIRRQYLRSSAMSAKLAFNTSSYPADRHSSLLITLPAASCVKLYQIFPTYSRERRGSTATADSVSTTRSTKTASNSRGKFLMSFLPPFLPSTAGVVPPRRKSILDARWVAGGRAILALLEDGEWGIWDLEAIGPSSSNTSANLIRGQANISGINGGSLTKFAIRSVISSPTETKPKTGSIEEQPASGTLAPMTPSTRKVRSEGLFTGLKQDSTNSRPHKLRGSIYVEAIQSGRPHDECAVISYGEENVYLSSVQYVWRSEVKPVRLPAVKLGGQSPLCFSLLSRPRADPEAAGVFGISAFIPDFLVQTSHRLILSVNPLTDEVAATNSSRQVVSSLVPQASDQALLASGDLDVDGMDRLLDEMGGGASASKPKPMNIFTKSVGFQLDGEDDTDDDDDEDVPMASPTPTRFASLKVGNSSRRFGPGGQVPQRRIFT
ncbi:hypothetical protein PV08_07847 [Exophiala spinifera]|uniref:Nucleoporin NUP37 n=1 Tax=Exophiala spinifera TaxID=91928 RepID=A0A0D2B8T4_9EURO|nr:uncharacterized protein PV08_07847 [Exophiala spinifera]KIW15060.1 hypothetical protein PV08_07847 [Exophiala spinifera]